MTCHCIPMTLTVNEDVRRRGDGEAQQQQNEHERLGVVHRHLLGREENRAQELALIR